GALWIQRRHLDAHGRYFDGIVETGFLAQIAQQLLRRRGGVFPRDEPAVNLDAAAIRDRVDTGAAFDATDAERRWCEQRIAGAGPQQLGKLLDANQQPAHAIDGVYSLLRRRAVT